MRNLSLLAALASVAIATPAQANDATDISVLEAEWSRAFHASDYVTIERIVAPEFKLLRVEADGETTFTTRAGWIANAHRMTFKEYETKVVDVTSAGDTAVATVEGHWNVTMAGLGSRSERFVLTDTWVKRNGAWQVIFRHSRPLPAGAPAQ
jgi:ketosteroid isomerase-like protein